MLEETSASKVSPAESHFPVSLLPGVIGLGGLCHTMVRYHRGIADLQKARLEEVVEQWSPLLHHIKRETEAQGWGEGSHMQRSQSTTVGEVLLLCALASISGPNPGSSLG